MDQIADDAAFCGSAVSKADGIRLLRSECIDFFCPDSGKGTQWSRITAEVNIIGFTNDTAHIGRDQYTAIRNERFQSFLHSRFYHVKNRCDNDLVTTEIRIDRDHIHGNVTVIEVFVILMNLIDVQKIDIRAAHVFEGPVVIPVKDDADICAVCGTRKQRT